MSEFANFAWPLRRAGFRKIWDSRSGGIRVAEWRREDPDGRTLVCQIWEDGKHRVSNEWVGCTDTAPTEFTNEAEMTIAVEREATRLDNKYRDPNKHYAQKARAYLSAKQNSIKLERTKP